MKNMSILIVYKTPRPEDKSIHDRAFEQVKFILEKYNLKFESIRRGDLCSGWFNNELIISIGGDGTLLAASHCLKNNSLLGVNSNPKSSVGSLCVSIVENFEEILKDFLDKKIEPIKVARIELELDGQKISELALNDILVSNQNPAMMTRYNIKFSHKTAFHRNSGLWVSSACGSSGAMASTGGQVQKIEDKKLQWICREPYYDKLPRPELLGGFFKENKCLEIRSLTQDQKIYIDGPHKVLDFKENSVLKIFKSKHDLNLIFSLNLEKRRYEIGSLRENNAEGGTRTRTGVPGRF